MSDENFLVRYNEDIVYWRWLNNIRKARLEKLFHPMTTPRR
jgi:hypothetical protein